MSKTKFILALVLSTFIVSSVGLCQDSPCRIWDIQEIKAMPSWYRALPNSNGVSRTEKLVDDRRVTEYRLCDTCVLIYSERVEPLEIQVYKGEKARIGFDGLLTYACRADTSLLDSLPFGIAGISFGGCGYNFVLKKTVYANEDYYQGHIIHHVPMDSMSALVFATAGKGTLAVSEDGMGILFLDYGDLYFANVMNPAPELVFSGGGSATIGRYPCDASERQITDIQWSPDTQAFVFMYYSDIEAGEFRLYQGTLKGD